MRTFDSTIFTLFAASAAEAGGGAFLCVPQTDQGPQRDISYEDALKAIGEVRDRYARAGFGHGHRVALVLKQRPEFVLHFLALNSLGCAVVPMNPDYTQDEFAYILEHSEADVVIALADAMRVLAAAASSLAVSIEAVDLARFDGDLPDARRAPPSASLPDGRTIASILYTSGTTGRPKGCVLTNECHFIAGNRYATMGGVVMFTRGEERIYNPTPFYHVNNLLVSLTCAMLLRSCHVLPERFSPSKWWQEVCATGATVLHYVGIVPLMLFNQPVDPFERRHKARFAIGAGIEATLHRAIEERFGLPFVEIWGMTEIPRVTGDTHEPRKVGMRAIGSSDDEYEIVVADDQGRPVPDETDGELLIRARGANPGLGFFAGYLKDQAATDHVWRDGWFHTGDVVRRAPDGMVHFVDRKKNIIRRSGENISAVEVEAAIATHEAVGQVAVIAVRDELREEEVMACIVLKPDVTASGQLAEAIQQWSACTLAYFKVPGYISFLESLPMTASNRVQRAQIFASDVDPRAHAATHDLRHLKRRVS